MGNLIFLVGAIALSVVGSVLLWLRHREPTSFMSSIDDFSREMTALSGERPTGEQVPGRAPVEPLRPSAGRGPGGASRRASGRGLPGRRASRTVRRPIVPMQSAPGLAESLAASRRRLRGGRDQDTQ
jgi:hypothetical protein